MIIISYILSLVGISTDPVAKAGKQVNKAMSGFRKAHKKVSAANEAIAQAIQDEERRIQEAKDRQLGATKLYRSNSSLLGKLDSFLPAKEE